MGRAKFVIISGSERNKLYDISGKTIKLIDGFRYTRLFIRTIVTLAVPVFSLFAIVLLVLYFNLLEKTFVYIFDALLNSEPNKNQPVNTCYMGLTTPCLLNGLLDPIPRVQLEEIYTNIEQKQIFTSQSFN